MDYKPMQQNGHQQKPRGNNGFGGPARYGTHKPFQQPGMEMQQPQQQQGFMGQKDNNMMLYQNCIFFIILKFM